MKGVVLQTDPAAHYIDHLGVLAAILRIPFLFTDEEQWEIAKKYYPGLESHLVAWEEVSPKHLLEKFDVFYSSVCCDRQFFEEAVAPFRGSKKLTSVYCPHGNSDKGDNETLQLYLNHDAVLFYGQHMADFLQETHVWNQLSKKAVVGNFRYLYYMENKKTLDQFVQTEILNRFARRNPTLLYCQTWNPDFFTTHIPVLESLPDDFNLVVKVHPRLMSDHYGMMLRVMHQYEKKPNVQFLTDFPLIYPLLAHMEGYIGDISSVGYDFLTFNRPMFFLNPYKDLPDPKRTLYLYKAGRTFHPNQLNYSTIEQDLSNGQPEFSLTRKDLYHYTFAPLNSFEAIRSEISNMLQPKQ